MKGRKFLVMMLTMVMGIILTACGGEEDSANSQDTEQDTENDNNSEEVTVIRYNSSRPSTDPAYEWYEEFFDEIEERSNGTVEFERYASEALGSSADMIEASSQGEPVINDGDFAYLGEYLPDLGVLTAPYLVREPEDWMTLWESETVQDLFTQLEDQGLKVMANFYVGKRNLITTEEINNREEVQGKTLRTAPSKLWTEVGNVLGGEPTNVPINDAYQAFSQGVVDGAEMSTSYIDSLSWYEVAPYITETEHILSTTTLIMSSEVYNSLPEEAQNAIDEVALEYQPILTERFVELEEELKENMESEGAIFSEIDKTPFIEVAQDMPNEFPEWSDGLYEQINEELGY